MASDGALLAGTESPGRVFRMTTDGAGFLLLDSGLQEISALRPGAEGVVYAAAFSGEARPLNTRQSSSPEPVATDAGPVGVDRDHVDGGRRAGRTAR